MRRRPTTLLIATTVLVLAAWAIVRAAGKAAEQPTPPTSRANWAPEQRDTLRGLQGVNVGVEIQGFEENQLPFSKGALQTDVELQLRQYGIRVLSDEELRRTPAGAALMVGVHLYAGTRGDARPVPFYTEINVYQKVLLARDPKVQCMSQTWGQTYLGSVGRENIRQVRETVKDPLAVFINDYLAANSGQPSPETPEKEKGE